MSIPANKETRPRLLRAGVAKSEITTDLPGKIIRDQLFAKALVLDDGAVRLVLLTLDAVAIGGICDVGDDFLSTLRHRITGELGIPGAHVLVTASHTHPPDRILCEEKELLERTFDAVGRALENQAMVLVGSGIGQEDRIQMNRNLRMKNGRHWTLRHANPGPPEEDIAGVGPIDTDVGVLRIDRMDGSPLAVVYNFGCHLLFGDTAGGVSANFPGVTSRILEEFLGDGAMAFFVQGSAGDVIDVGFKDFNHVRNVEVYGLRLAFAVLSTWKKIAPRSGSVAVVSETIDLPRRWDFKTRREELLVEQEGLLASLRFIPLNFKSFFRLYLAEKMNPDFPLGDSWQYLQAESVGDREPLGMDAFNRKNIDKYLTNIRAMERLARIQDDLATVARHEEINRGAGDSVSAEIQAVRIGDYVLVAAPLEVLTEVGLNIKRDSPFPETHIASFSNGYLHYGPPASDYSKGGYEVTECLLAPEWQAVFESAVRGILGRLGDGPSFFSNQNAIGVETVAGSV